MKYIISQEELSVIPGYKRATQQAKFLDENGIRYLINSNGQVITTSHWMNGWDKYIVANQDEGFNMDFLQDAS
jgi:hypothetical protein